MKIIDKILGKFLQFFKQKFENFYQKIVKNVAMKIRIFKIFLGGNFEKNVKKFGFFADFFEMFFGAKLITFFRIF